MKLKCMTFQYATDVAKYVNANQISRDQIQTITVEKSMFATGNLEYALFYWA